jgi:nanoRNase/pAp phosphatase (c-di-AMP/oligoRNAs hydrolase)
MRLITRSDFDGLVCAVLLKAANIIDDRKFVHPKDVQDGLVEVTSNDVLANVPYVKGCGLWFDHHSSEDVRLDNSEYEGAFQMDADSTARVIFNYYGGVERFGNRFDDLLYAVDKSDAAKFSIDDIVTPRGGVLLSFIMDARTGLGRYKDYRISNYELMDKLIDYCQDMTLDEILELPDVKERVIRYFEHQKWFEETLRTHSWADEHILVTDFRDLPETPAGNRFLVYTLYPETSISIRIFQGKLNNIVFAVGYNIFNPTSRTDVGKLMLTYGGGGHRKAGTCQVLHGESDRVLEEMVDHMKEDEQKVLAGVGAKAPMKNLAARAAKKEPGKVDRAAKKEPGKVDKAAKKAVKAPEKKTGKAPVKKAVKASATAGKAAKPDRKAPGKGSS